MADFTYNLSYFGASGMIASLAYAASSHLNDIEKYKALESTEFSKAVVQMKATEVLQIVQAYNDVKLFDAAERLMERLSKLIDVEKIIAKEKQKAQPPF